MMADDDRFQFGDNWRRFLSLVNEERILIAERSLQQMLGGIDLKGRSILDVGCGSGLFSLAARRLGTTVYSFDYDSQSTACATELKRRYFPDDPDWTVENGSVLDADYLKSLGSFDIVYSWGVLHHTGAMWEALDNVSGLVAENGRLCIAIYNDQGGMSRRWRAIKRLYVKSPKPVQWLMAVSLAAILEIRSTLIRLLQCRNPLPFQDWEKRKKERGMSPWYDIVDWVGGYPFEVAKPEEIFNFYRDRGFTLTYLTTHGRGSGCNEYTFVKSSKG